MRLSTLLVLVPVAVIAATLGVANREEVVFKLDPFAPQDSAYAFVMPLFLLVFLSFLLGVLVGAATIALRHGRRARAKRIAASTVPDALALDGGGRMAPPNS
ncbi:MAG TPA: hypothetical protein VNH44_01375 [Micropepsaceae bacterium]|nr:hypothetical protein [Micropepsaceae bacterium]